MLFDARQPSRCLVVAQARQTPLRQVIWRQRLPRRAAFEHLFQQGVHLITKLKSNMKNRLMPLSDKLLLRKRAIIESITDQLKNISQIEHTRHRSPLNFCVNVLCGLIAYCHQPKKPLLHLDARQLEAIAYPNRR